MKNRPNLTFGDARSRARKKTQAHDLRDMDSVPFRRRSIPPPFRALCQEHVLPRLKVKGYKQDQKHEIAMQCCLAAIKAELADKVIGDCRNTHNAGARQQAEAWDLLVEAGFCERCLGSEASGKTTRYRATKKLMNLQQVWEQAMLSEPRETSANRLLGLVAFKSKKKGSVSEIPFAAVIRAYSAKDHLGRPDEAAVGNFTAVTRVVEEIINQINSVNLDHSWKTTNEAGVYFQPSVELTQIHIGELWRGTRLYTRAEEGGQNLTKKARRKMLIDGEPVAELDLCGSLVQLAYNLRKLEAPDKEDAYAPHRVIPELWRRLDQKGRKRARKFIKYATLRCFNVESRSEAIGSVMKQWHESRHEAPIASLPSPVELVHRIAKAHRKVAEDLFSGRGMKLVTVEGQIMFHILREFVLHAGKPALAVHDALVVKVSDLKLAKSIVCHAYRQRTGFDPMLSVKMP